MHPHYMGRHALHIVINNDETLHEVNEIIVQIVTKLNPRMRFHTSTPKHIHFFFNRGQTCSMSCFVTMYVCVYVCR